MTSRKLRSLVLCGMIGSIPFLLSAQQFHAAAIATQRPLLWIEPVDIKTRNLYHGPGGPAGQPHAPLTFVKEDDSGTSPKFDVRDSDGTKWKAKTGPEAQPETVATRLLWAVGFLTNENYFLPVATIEGLPPLKRGQEFVEENRVKGVRLQRNKNGKRIGNWSWRRNPFQGTREFNGLRVMMALLSNWDLNDQNNAIFEGHANPDQTLYEVSDLGASFGRSGKSYSDKITKHNFAAYRRSKFISKVTKSNVDFAFPTHPPFLYVFNLPFFLGKIRTRWIGKHIPREDARWIGSQLAQLSDAQIEDAFRAGGYSQKEADQYTAVVKSRIAELDGL